ncbi:MAG: tyrosine-type recombinase/integrase [Symploca sp. SIO1C4]|uniref:Tyrosine-type recombinase/integrase n=1 Tax=Symploca sp. SIO1C4 TaxID=2607765 RepID=A0A6B3N9R4_9CYAN|nr:tyrosine-type recombinase/integrase [Symploca sp. SIO1C4]
MTRAHTTAQLFSRWIHGKPKNTQLAYERDIRHFAAFLSQASPQQVTLNDLDLHALSLDDLQLFMDYMESKGLAPSTRNRRMSAIKSFLGFAHKVGYITVNVGVAMELLSLENRLAERILSETQVTMMIALESGQRDKLLLKTLYYTGARVSEVCNLIWRDVHPNRDSGQISLFGKGGKGRVVRIPASLYQELEQFRANASIDAPVFPSQKGNKGLQRDRIHEIVRAAGERIGIKGVSPHWLRHAHASHSLERNAPIHLVQQTLGHSSIATTSKYLHAKPNDSSGMYLPS